MLISLDKENSSVYIDRAYEKVSGQTEAIGNVVEFHLCSAHIIKAVLQAFGKKTTNRGVKEFVLFTFAYLLNCSSMKIATEAFLIACVLFDAEEYTNVVNLTKA